MKPRESLVRLKRFQVDEKRRRVTQIEMMIAEFTRVASDLDREIASEENRAGITDQSHFAYPTYAKAAAQRRDNLRRSADELLEQLSEAKSDMDAAAADLTKAEQLEDREQVRFRPAEPSRDQALFEAKTFTASSTVSF
ncbi:flagellar export protein FliJ [Chelatococcus asaccharovorans]|uniref:Flagellar export protein FliJ n=1 Tax=Chelatococcus asaccharovorans TaxID=28210 RepID=A0A2V3U9I3_9HYPH|nr:flagellar export protein FliJ [Chelatococcus asaccharovorans]MBS7705227.1 flagellar export protein FliJ [Chelatococcus asaccharovorans]PXW60369.1 flagellar export protein FliJ [Chelatococcus asaccharovorans]